MATLRIYNEIADEECKLLLQATTGASSVSYKDISEFIAGMGADDTQIDIRLHCPGGSCIEGWAMYDALRRSGKEIGATIEGECSSMATIILLAAPKERRVAYKNAHICIHNPAVETLNVDAFQRLTADKLELTAQEILHQAKALRQEQEKILDLYVERTGASRKTLKALMDKDTLMDAQQAQELGFISQILVPTTAKRQNSQYHTNSLSQLNDMTRKEKKIALKEGLFSRLLAKAGLARIEDLKIIDQIITAANGSEFTVEREAGDPQVGDTAYPDGSYVLSDGTTVVVAGSVITDIVAPTELVLTPTPETQPQTITVAQADNAQAAVEPTAQVDAEPTAQSETELTAQSDAPQMAASSTEEEYEAEIAQLREQITNQFKEQIAKQQEQIAQLNQTIATLQQTIGELRGQAPTETERDIVSKVNGAGGLAWLEQILSMRSTFNATNRKFIDHTLPKDEAPESKTRLAIRQQREAAQVKRSKREL